MYGRCVLASLPARNMLVHSVQDAEISGARDVQLIRVTFPLVRSGTQNFDCPIEALADDHVAKWIPGHALHVVLVLGV